MTEEKVPGSKYVNVLAVIIVIIIIQLIDYLFTFKLDDPKANYKVRNQTQTTYESKEIDII
jgi:hypothetical protein